MVTKFPDSIDKQSVAGEHTPLLRGSEEEGIPYTKSRDDDKPLPKAQIFLLCYARLFEPIAFFSIFPFVNQMIQDVGDVDEADVGFYSGLIESLFSLTQMLLMISWGRAADRFGRKPVLVTSLAGVSIATALFGLSRNLWQMVLFRCLAGVFAGTVVTIRTMIAENSTAKTQAQAFSFFVFTGNLGIFLGPLIGGSLADPARQYPGIFGAVQIFKDYPYALSTFVTGMIAASAAVVTALFVKESMVQDVDSGAKASAAPISTVQIIKSPGVPSVLVIYGMVMLLSLAYTAIAPVFWFTSPNLGGYGFSPLWISIFLGAAGILQAFWVLVVFPPLQRRVGTGGVLRGCSYAFILFYALTPLTNIFLRNGLLALFWTVTSILQIVSSVSSMSATAVQLGLNDVSPSPAALGTLNGIALTVTSGIRAVAPIISTTIFAAGVRKQILGGSLVWVVLVFLALCLNVSVRWLPEKAQGKHTTTDLTK